MAVSGTASQVSTDYEGPAKLAIDGNTNGDYFAAKSTTHTAKTDDPWWEVDLGQPHNVDRVIIWNRTDGGSGARLKGFRVVALDKDRQPLWVQIVGAAPTPSVSLDLPKSADTVTDVQRKELQAYYLAGHAPELAAAQAKLKQLQQQLAGIRQAGTYKSERVIMTPQGTTIRVTDGRPVLNLPPRGGAGGRPG